MSSTWAVVVAALGAATLSTGGALLIETLRTRRTRHDTRSDSRLAAYVEVLTRSALVAATADTLRLTMAVRSGLADSISAATGIGQPVEPADIAHLLRRDFVPLFQATAQVAVVGTPGAIDATELVMRTAGDLLGVATSRGELGTKTARTVRGDRWTQEQIAELSECRRQLTTARRGLIDIARSEFGEQQLAWADTSAHLGATAP